jgi:hypothetical protein
MARAGAMTLNVYIAEDRERRRSFARTRDGPGNDDESGP